MRKNTRLFLSLLAILLLLSIALAPMASAAGRLTREWGFMWVPRNASVTYRLTVGQVRLYVPPGSMPRGGPVFVRVVSSPQGQFVADFLPDRQFQNPVIIGFGQADVVYYHSRRGEVTPIPTDDITGDGLGGEILTEHFSRYSGWY